MHIFLGVSSSLEEFENHLRGVGGGGGLLFWKNSKTTWGGASFLFWPRPPGYWRSSPSVPRLPSSVSQLLMSYELPSSYSSDLTHNLKSFLLQHLIIHSPSSLRQLLMSSDPCRIIKNLIWHMISNLYRSEPAWTDINSHSHKVRYSIKTMIWPPKCPPIQIWSKRPWESLTSCFLLFPPSPSPPPSPYFPPPPLPSYHLWSHHAHLPPCISTEPCSSCLNQQVQVPTFSRWAIFSHACSLTLDPCHWFVGEAEFLNSVALGCLGFSGPSNLQDLQDL